MTANLGPVPAVTVAVLDDYQHVALTSADWGVLDGRAVVTVFHDHLDDEDALVARLRSFDVIVAMRERTAFPAALLRRLPQLRLLVTTGMANASIDGVAAARQGVTVCGTRSTSVGTPELTWGLLLALVRDIPTEDAATRAGRWQVTIGRELAGSTIGLLGLGRIGQRIARYAKAFEMDVIAWSQNLTDERAAEHGARRVPKDELFTRADIVSIHLKLSHRTVGLVGARELSLLGANGYLVNTSRGPIVDESALVAALRDGTIAGAALDVFDVEPLPADHPLRSSPNTVITPHIGYVSTVTYRIFHEDAVEDIIGWLDGAPVRVVG
ncbi:MAG: D-2-hydroxyacid dehydrogenase family protein [Frankia sp.]